MTDDSSSNDELMAQISEVQAEYAEALMQKANVVGVGIGLRQRRGEYTDEICLVVMVSEKVPMAQLDAEDQIPMELDGIPVDVQATGEFMAE